MKRPEFADDAASIVCQAQPRQLPCARSGNKSQLTLISSFLRERAATLPACGARGDGTWPCARRGDAIVVDRGGGGQVERGEECEGRVDKDNIALLEVMQREHPLAAARVGASADLHLGGVPKVRREQRVHRSWVADDVRASACECADKVLPSLRTSFDILFGRRYDSLKLQLPLYTVRLYYL